MEGVQQIEYETLLTAVASLSAQVKALQAQNEELLELGRLSAKRYVSAKELSEYTSIPLKTVYRLTDEDVIPSCEVDGRIIYDLRKVEAWIEALHVLQAQ